MKLKFWKKDQAEIPQGVDEPRPYESEGVVVPANTLVHLGENGEMIIYEPKDTRLDIRYKVIYDADGIVWAKVDDLIDSYTSMRDNFVAGGSLPELVSLTDALIGAFTTEYEVDTTVPPGVVNFDFAVPTPEPVDERAWIGPLF